MGRVDLFDASKAAIVVELQATGEDKSPKGCLDAQVVDVVQAVNEHDDLVTTSSCSGRVALFASEGEEDVPVRDNGNFGDEVVETESTSAPLNKETATNQTPRKGAGRWLAVSHEAVWSGKDLSALIKSRESRLTQVVFKLEPFVLHVLCRDAAIAQRLLRAAMECGFRESGISLGPKKIIVAVRTTANALEVPLVHKGKLLLDDSALDALCEIATTKFDANTTRRNRFLAKVKALGFDREAIPANKKTTDEEQQTGQVEWSRIQFGSPELSGVLERWGHSAVALSDQQVMVFGGYGCGSTGGRVHQRLNDLVLLKEAQNSKWEVSVVTPLESSAPAPSTRVRHSCNLLLGNHLVVFGGRHGPSAALNDFHAFNVDTSQWQEVSVSMSGGEPLAARWGHTSTTLPGGNTFAIFGGRNDSQLFNDLIFVTVKPNSNGTQLLCEKPSMSGDIPDARFSHSATLVGEHTLMVFGGYGALAVETSKSDLVIGTTHLLDLNTMVWTKVASGRPRFSHQAVAVGSHRVLITGGVCGEFSNSTAALFDTQTETWHTVPSGDAYGGQASPVAMFQKFSLVSLGGDKQRIVALGGGALCFSFGFYFSPPLLCNGIAWLGSIDLTPNAVLAAKASTKQIKNLLEKSKLYDKSRRIAPYESEVAIPVLDTLKALQALELDGKSSIAVFAQLPPAKLTLANASQLETKKAPPSQRLEYRKSYTTLSTAKRKEITPPPATPPQDATDGLALVIPARMCKTVKTKLEEGGIYDKSRLIAPHGNGNLAVPFQGDKKLALEVAKSLGAAETEVIQVELPLAKLEAANLRALNEARLSNPSKKEHPKRRAAAASGTVRAKVLDWLVQKAPGQVPANDAKLRREIPNKLSLMDDVAIVPSECFKTTEVWDPVFALGEGDEDKCLWSFLARLAGAKRVLQQRRIDPGVKRSSRAALVFPRGESEEKGAMVSVKQNGVIYALDLTKCMFSAGNISEKTRVAEFDCSGQTVVDLFSGIGYFTLPYLVKTKAVHVHACEWNAEALDALRNNVALNKVDPAFVSIHPGDCRETVRTKLHGVADRVNLGLIPSSEPFWPSGAAALKPTSGGWLHVHENVDRNKQTEWVARLERDLAAFCSEAHGGEWVVLCKHLERVKSYSPRVDHVVADVLCTPKALASSDALKTAEKRKAVVEQAEASLSARPSRVRYPPREITPRKIEMVECPKTLAEARALFAKGEPVVLLNAVSSDTQALASLAALSRLCSEDTSVAEQQVSVHVADPGTKGKLSFVHKSFKFHVMKFQELLAHAREEDIFCYLRAIGSNPRKDRAHFWRDFKKLADHLKFDFPGHLIAQEHSSVLRIASKGLQLWTHYDVMQNILFQLEGRKRVLLFPPSASGALDFRGSSSSIVEVDNLENVDLNSPFAQARREAIEFYLEPGQALFIPPLWPHNVRSEEPGVAVNVFFKHLKDSQYASKDLYGNRDPIVAEKALEMVARAKDVLRAAQDDGSTLPPEYIEFYTGIAAALLHDD